MATETKNLEKLTKNLGLYLGQDQLEQVKKGIEEEEEEMSKNL